MSAMRMRMLRIVSVSRDHLELGRTRCEHRRNSLGNPLLVRRQISAIHLGRLDRGVTEPVLQVVDRTAVLQPGHGVKMAQIVKAERAEVALALFWHSDGE